MDSLFDNPLFQDTHSIMQSVSTRDDSLPIATDSEEEVERLQEEKCHRMKVDPGEATRTNAIKQMGGQERRRLEMHHVNEIDDSSPNTTDSEEERECQAKAQEEIHRRVSPDLMADAYATDSDLEGAWMEHRPNVQEEMHRRTGSPDARFITQSGRKRDGSLPIAADSEEEVVVKRQTNVQGEKHRYVGSPDPTFVDPFPDVHPIMPSRSKRDNSLPIATVDSEEEVVERRAEKRGRVSGSPDLMFVDPSPNVHPIMQSRSNMPSQSKWDDSSLPITTNSEEEVVERQAEKRGRVPGSPDLMFVDPSPNVHPIMQSRSNMPSRSKWDDSWPITTNSEEEVVECQAEKRGRVPGSPDLMFVDPSPNVHPIMQSRSNMPSRSKWDDSWPITTNSEEVVERQAKKQVRSPDLMFVDAFPDAHSITQYGYKRDDSLPFASDNEEDSEIKVRQMKINLRDTIRATWDETASNDREWLERRNRLHEFKKRIARQQVGQNEAPISLLTANRSQPAPRLKTSAPAPTSNHLDFTKLNTPKFSSAGPSKQKPGVYFLY